MFPYNTDITSILVCYTVAYVIHVISISHCLFNHMKFIYDQQLKHITLTVSELSLLYTYLYRCHSHAFHGVYNFTNHAKEREYLYYWHLIVLIQKVHIKFVSKSLKKSNRRIWIKLNEPEVMVLKVCMQRIEIDQDLQITLLKQISK